MIALLGYVADVLILGTYALLSQTGKVRPLHWANALGCFPLLYLEINARLWPVVIITGMFGVLGWFGVWRTR